MSNKLITIYKAPPTGVSKPSAGIRDPKTGKITNLNPAETNAALEELMGKGREFTTDDAKILYENFGKNGGKKSRKQRKNKKQSKSRRSRR